MRILIVDLLCPHPYDESALGTGGLGGTEATVVRVASRLAAEHDVVVVQHCREVASSSASGVQWRPGHVRAFPDRVDHAIVLRTPTMLPFLRRRYPSARLHVWLHDLQGPRLAVGRDDVVATGAEVVAVSRWHAGVVGERLLPARPPVRVHYNPIDDDLVPDGTPVDPHKLVFTSSPHKGLADALRLFEALRRRAPFELHLFNPGYFPTPSVATPGVVDHGPRPYREVIEHVRGALCLFHPNRVFAETFGLVYAEASAVGTPSLTHALGAVPEVVARPADELVDVSKPEDVVERVLAWHAGARPVVAANPAFRLSAVVDGWREALR